MLYLTIVSVVWAFSFGLIGGTLRSIDPLYVAAYRLLIATIVFLPFLRLQSVPRKVTFKLAACGAIQFGLMYVTYISAFQFLPSYLVALFSIATPIYVVLIGQCFDRAFRFRYMIAALIAVGGAAVLKFENVDQANIWTGFVLMQIAGLAFGFGQVYYRSWKSGYSSLPDHSVFGILYLGGAAVAVFSAVVFGDFDRAIPDLGQSGALLYLGFVASGLGFFLWNKGATLTNTGTLAAFNNALVPLAVIFSLFVWGEWTEVSSSALVRLAIGGGLIAVAVWISQKTPASS